MRTLVFLVLCFLTLAQIRPTQGDEPKPSQSSVVMEKKLEYAQDILKGLMNKDFDRLDRDAKLMKVFTRLEEMYRGKQPEYREQLAKFQNSVTALSAAVDQKKQDDASRAYLNMVDSCIQCHRILRPDSRPE
ncbi:MAG: hypothetical protein C0483_22550 [Pirellula sp.]|nr:hypothetical protein [Pirellula sp.]